MTSTTSETLTQVASTRQAPTKVVTGERIAKAFRTYSSWDRAEDAARWERGEVQVDPTTKLAAQTFGVPVALVRKAREHLARLDMWRERVKHNGNGNSTTTLSDAALDRIVKEVGAVRVMASIGRGFSEGVLPEVTDYRVEPMTQPLQAAE